MEHTDFRDRAYRNRVDLSNNSYVGRGLVFGLNEAGTHYVLGYWIKGRSDDSRNRIFVQREDGSVHTALANPHVEVRNRNLIIYRAMDERPGQYIVSNGEQTDLVLAEEPAGHEFVQVMSEITYEPDDNHTPRITGTLLLDKEGHEKPTVLMAINKKSEFSDACKMQIFADEDFYPGLGRYITTYTGDGQPLPSFEGEPKLLSLPGRNHKEIASGLWNALNSANRVGLVVRLVNVEDGHSETMIINKITTFVITQLGPEPAPPKELFGSNEHIEIVKTFSDNNKKVWVKLSGITPEEVLAQYGNIRIEPDLTYDIN